MPHTPEQKREYNRRPEVVARQRIFRKHYQSTPEYKMKRKEYLARPDIRERERMRSKLRYTTPDARLRLRERRMARRRFLKVNASKRTYYQKIRAMMEKDYIEWIACVAGATGHSPYGVLQMSRILGGCL